jgi:hypothetical protein
MGWATFWAIFVTNSSGHPVGNSEKTKQKNFLFFHVEKMKK